MDWGRMRDCGNYALGKRKRRKSRKKLLKLTADKIVAGFRADLVRRRTPAEAVFEKVLRESRTAFEFQKIIYAGKKVYIVDFFLPGLNIVIEVDGGYHLSEKQKRKDAARERDLKRCGVSRIFRFSNDEVLSPGFSNLLNYLLRLL